MKQIAKLNKISKRVDKITKEIQLLILNLPDNPNIKRLSDNPHAFIISSSQLFGNRNNPLNRMDVFYHDFKAQYKYVSEVLKKARPENVVPLLQRIVSEGKHKDRADYKNFNPVVIRHLKNLMET